MKLVLPSGTSSYTTFIFVKDSSSTTGAGLTGLAYNTAGLTLEYIRKGQGSTTTVTLASATLGTWTSGGLVVVNGTTMPGVYELGIPNACFSGGTCILYLKGAANMVPVKIEIQLEPVPSNVTQYGGTGAQFINAYPIVNAFDRQLVASSTNNTLTVSATMSNGANYVGHLMTITNATGLYDTVMCTGFSAPSTFTANRNWRTNPDNTSIVTFFFSNGARVDANGNVLSDVQSILGTQYTGTAGYFVDWSKIQNGTATVGLSGTTISTSQTITSVSGAVGSVTGAVGSVTGNVGGNVIGTVASVVGNVGGNVVGSVASVTAGVTVTTNNDKTGYSLSSAYDDAKTAAQPGDQMDLVNAPNSTALSAIAAAIWNALTSGITTSGSIGKLIVDGWAKFTGITYVAKWLSMIMGKTADSTTLTEIRLQTASANYDNTTMSLESIHDGGGGATQADVEAGTAEVIARIDGLAAGGVELNSPVSTDGGTLTVTQGDDLYSADYTAATWDVTGTFPSISGATAVLNLSCGGVQQTVTGLSLSLTGSTLTITAQIPSATTTLLPEGTGVFQVRVTWANTHGYTYVNGTLIVVRKASA